MSVHLVPTLLPALAALLLLSYIVLRLRYRFPPGPKGLPIIGNVFDVRKPFQWLIYQEWSREHNSNIVHFEILGTHFVVLNSAKAAADLFERRSKIYSDKPEAPMLHMSGWARNWGMMKYGDYWRAHRRLFHQYFRSTIVSTYHPALTKSVREAICALRDTPDQFMQHVRVLAGSNILRIIYGVEVESENDPNIALVEEGVRILSVLSNAGAYLVDAFPILQYVPAWFPGAQFKRDAAKWRLVVDEMYIRPYMELKASFDNGIAKPCVLNDILSDISRGKEGRDFSVLEDVVINTTGTAYAGASDTTTSTLLTFVLAMSMHPELQKRAQEELDGIVGQYRLPEMEDQDALPFITAIMKECLRWRPVLPLGMYLALDMCVSYRMAKLAHDLRAGVAHQSLADDEYKGFYIPAGSVIIGNTWAILHDAERYPDPDTFNPYRFVDREGRLQKDAFDPMEAFGYGRRMCPGRYFALDFMWLAMANILAVFSIQKPVDELGNVIEPSGVYTTGLFSFPAPFRAAFKLRGNRDIPA